MDKQFDSIPFSGLMCQVTADDPQSAVNVSPFEIGADFRIESIRCSLVEGTTDAWNVEATVVRVEA